MRFSKTTAVLGAVFIAFVFFCLGNFASGGRATENYSITTAASGVPEAAKGICGSADDPVQPVPATQAADAGGETRMPEEEAASTETPDAALPININTASAGELEALPGIGATLSGRIVAYRNTYGAFKSVTDLKNVEGIGDKRFEAIESMICVD